MADVADGGAPMTRAEHLCRCGHYRDSHGSRTEQRGGQKVYVQKCEHCACENFTDRDGPLSRFLDEFKSMTQAGLR